MPPPLIVPSMDGVTTERLRFRHATLEDRGWWMEYMRDSEAIRFMSFRVGSEEDCTTFIQRTLDRRVRDGSGLNAVIEAATGRPVGMVGLLTQEVDAVQELEVGYHFVPGAWGRGYAAEAAIACRRFAGERGLVPSVISLIDPHNVRSQRVAVRNAMLPEKVSMHRGHEAIVFRHTFPRG